MFDPDILNAFLAGFRVLPALIQTVEKLSDHTTTGDEKKNAVQTLFQGVVFGTAMGFGVAGKTDTATLITTIAPLASPVIDEIVNAFHVSGLFSHKKTAPVVTAPSAPAPPPPPQQVTPQVVLGQHTS